MKKYIYFIKYNQWNSYIYYWYFF